MARYTVLLAVFLVLDWVLTARAADAPATQPSLAELPHWPIGLRLSDELVGERTAKNKTRKADVLAWIPPGAKRIRAMMLCPDNSDSKIFHEYEATRKMAAKHEVAIVYVRVSARRMWWCLR